MVHVWSINSGERFQGHHGPLVYSHIMATANMFMYFLGFINIRLGHSRKKNQEDPVRLVVRPCKSQSVVHRVSVCPCVSVSVRALTFFLNIFFSETTYRILMKFHRNVPAMVLFRIS